QLLLAPEGPLRISIRSSNLRVDNRKYRWVDEVQILVHFRNTHAFDLGVHKVEIHCVGRSPQIVPWAQVSQIARGKTLVPRRVLTSYDHFLQIRSRQARAKLSCPLKQLRLCHSL